MKKSLILLSLSILLGCQLKAASSPIGSRYPISPVAARLRDSILPVFNATDPVKRFSPEGSVFSLAGILNNKHISKSILGFTRQLNPIEVYYFPGTSQKR